MPRKISELLTLGGDIKAKHVADGAASLIPADLANTLTTAYDRANAKHAEQQQLLRDAEQRIEQRNTIIGLDEGQDTRTPGTLLFYITSVRDILQGVFLGDEKNLGEWGYTVNTPKGKVNIPIPRRAAEITTLSNSIVAKHTADGAASPLPADIMTDFAAALTQANALLAQSAQLKRDAEKATQQRNKLIGFAKEQNSKSPNTLLSAITAVRNLLLGHFRGAEQTLGDWGFTVNMSAPAAQPIPPQE